MATLYRRGDVFYVYAVLDGKKIRQAVGKDPETAEEARKALEREVLRAKLEAVSDQAEPGGDRAGNEVTFAEFADRWYQKADAGWSESYRVQLKRGLRHLTRHFGPDRLLAEISAEDCEGYRAARRRLVSPCTVNHEIFLLRGMLRKAVVWGYIERSPAEGVKLLSYRRREVEPLSREECRALLKGARALDAHKPRRRGAKLRWIILTLLHTGLRVSELAALRCENVDLRRNMLWLPEAKTDRSTSGGRRQSVPIPAAIRGVLTEAMGRRLEGPLFCAGVQGDERLDKPLERHTIRRRIERAARRAGIRHVTPHDLRRTFLSLLTETVDVFTAMRLARHRLVSTTQRYVGRAPENLQRATDRLDLASGA